MRTKYNRTYLPMGGCLFDPPITCKHRFMTQDKGIWTDLGCCVSICKNPCSQYNKFKRMSSPHRSKWLKRKGVLYQDYYNKS